MAIRNKPKKEQHLILDASPYDIPDVVLELVSKICLAIDTSNYPERLGKPLSKIVFGNDDHNDNKSDGKECLYQYFLKKRDLFCNIDFLHDLIRIINKLAVEIKTDNNKSNIRIIVAGGFDAGKSTFINNALIGKPNFLPVSNIPTTSVATSVYFTSHENNCRVKAVNLKGVVVSLDERLLQVIRHKQGEADKQNLSVAKFIMSVLKELYIEVNSDRFSGCTFVDTPGFGNSDKSNDFNGKNDDQIASEMFLGADFLIWITDGQLDSKDLERIASFNGPFAIMLNKVGENRGMTKKLDEIKEKIDTIYNQLNESTFKGNVSKLVDVFAYSYYPDKEKIRYSKNDYESIDEILNIVKDQRPKQYKHYSIIQLEELFDREISESVKRKKDIGIHLRENKLQYYYEQKEKYIADEEITKLVNNVYVSAKKYFDDRVSLKDEIQSHIERIKGFKNLLVETIKIGEKKFRDDIIVQDATTVSDKKYTIFEAIDTGNDLLFRKSLDGVDLFATNDGGYTPLTYAVKSGNNTMVKILLELGSAPEFLDKNGKNAFHVATECQYRDMCEILINWKGNKDLFETSTKDGASVWDLASKNSFHEWLKGFYKTI